MKLGREATAARIVALFPGARQAAGSRTYETELWLRSGLGRGATVRDDGSKVSINLPDLPAELALRILAQVASEQCDASGCHECGGNCAEPSMPHGASPRGRPRRIR